MSKKKSTNRAEEGFGVFASLAGFFYSKWRFSLLFFAALIALGAITYTSVIKREGFPPIQFPLSLVNGTYFVDDKSQVDEVITQPLSESLSVVEGVSEVRTTANDNFFTAFVFFDSDVDTQLGAERIQEAIDQSDSIPAEVREGTSVLPIDPAAYLNEFDLLLSVYSIEDNSPESIEEAADYVLAEFLADPSIAAGEVQSLFAESINPRTGELETRQVSFNQIGLKQESGEVAFYGSVTIGLDRDDEAIDIIELSELVNDKIASLDLSQFGDEYVVTIGADFAESINTQISSLQSNLLTGFVAVAAVSFLLITWRASIITGLFMLSVMAVSVLMLYVFGYTLNTITLFGLVLALGLFVDDATIVVESIYAHRNKSKDKLKVVRQAAGKIGAASFAGTFTTVLVFLPLAFISGILGEFIRLLPVTVIIALVTSLFLSLTLIPVLSRFVLLRTTSPSWITRHNPIIRLEATLARWFSGLPRMLKTAPRKGRVVATVGFLISIVFLMVAGQFYQRLEFNIFPPTKDSDQLNYQLEFPAGYTLEQAEASANIVNGVINDVAAVETVRVLYGGFEQPSARGADAVIELVSFTERDKKSPEILEDITAAATAALPSDVSFRIIQIDGGPPAEEFPLKIQVFDEDEAHAIALATEVGAFIEGAEVTRPNGTTATVTEVELPSGRTITRIDGKAYVELSAKFDASDTSALLIAAEELVQEQFSEEYLVENGYEADTLGFDFGQESENAESFANLAIVFPLALVSMYILLALQFRSLLQPILIFVAIPFTFLGVFAGLYFTDNALSFFVQVGLIGLIGIAVNNTILLVTYANQEKLAGEGTIDAISNAVQKRFRPLVATTITTVAALLPLALSDPFWEALAMTIIFGLISSTVLVIISFPYYYLAAEWLRMRVSKGTRQARKEQRKSKRSEKPVKSAPAAKKTVKKKPAKTAKKTTTKKKK